MISENSERLEPLLALSDDLSYFPRQYYTPRRPAFVGRILLLTLLAFAVYLPAFRSPMIWLDVTRVRNNVLLRTLGGLGHIWRHPNTQSTYRPMAGTMLWLEFHICRLSAGGYHFFSLIFHAVSGVLLWFILRRLSVRGAWLAACVFLLHPIQTQAVAWISQQDTILAAMFSLAAMLSYLRYARVHPEPPSHYAAWFIPQSDGTLAPDLEGGLPPERRSLWYAAALLLYVCALLTRTDAAIVPILLVIILWGFRGRLHRSAWVSLLPFFLAAAAWIAFQPLVLHARTADSGAVPTSLLALLAPHILLFYAAKLYVPYPLLFVYPRWQISASVGSQYLFPTLLCGLATAIWVARKKVPRSVLAAAYFYIGAMLPVCGIFPTEWTRYSYVADHFQYLACAGLIAATVGCLVGPGSADGVGEHLSNSRRWWRLIGGGILISVLGCLTWWQATLYLNEKTLWEATLRYDPHSPTAHLSLGNLFFADGKFAAAVEEFGQSLEADPGNVIAVTRLGQTFEEQGRFDKAIEQYEKAAAIQPREAEHQSSLAAAYGQSGNLTAALAAFERALALRPNDELIYNNLGLLLAENGKLDRAIAEYQNALQINPDSLPVHINLANALFRQGHLDEAADQLQQVMKFDPNNFEAYMNAGAMLGQLKQFPKAERMYRAAVQVRPTSAEAYNYLGITLAAQGNLSEANYSFGKSIELKPGFAEAQQNLRRTEEQLKAKALIPGK